MHPEVKEPLSAVVVTPDLGQQRAEVLDLRRPESPYVASIASADHKPQ